MAALLIDWLVLSAVEGVLAIMLVVLSPNAANGGQLVSVSAAISWAYFALLESSPAQATLGKLALGIKVTDTAGGAITFRRATVRYWSKLLSTLMVGIGWLLPAVTPRRQALHDLLAGTLVVRAGLVAPAAHWDPGVAGFQEYWDGTGWVREQR
jgi:uncharacterized RDD family membrane protein YckC